VNVSKIAAIGFLLVWPVLATHAAGVQFTGVNLAGAEFTENRLPGAYGNDYIYPSTSDVDYFLGKGMNIIRLPFRWERLQHSTNAPLNATELGRIQTLVNHTTARGAYVLLDLHNYGRYYNTNVIGGPALPISAFTNLWGRLASVFRNQPRIIFGLMNEPHDMSTHVWRDAANAAITAIRGLGATNLILVPGNGWSIAHDWYASWYGTPNSTVMLGITDPLNNYAFEVHDYFDNENTNQDCDPHVGVNRLTQFTAWCRTNGRRGFYGEFGVSTNTTCLVAMSNMLAYVNANADVWLGWTYWAAGPWWGDYRFSIQPVNGLDKPQTDVLQNGIPIHAPLLSVRQSPFGTDTALRFTTRGGFRYQPQTSLTLDPPSWTNYGASYTGLAQLINVWMRTSSNHHGFFRLNVTRLPSSRRTSGEFFDRQDQQGTRASPRHLPEMIERETDPRAAIVAAPVFSEDAANRLR
jgi:endoglucanase